MVEEEEKDDSADSTVVAGGAEIEGECRVPRVSR